MRRRIRFEHLEDRRLLAGVTLMTHGFGGNVDGWITTLADAVAARAEPSEQPRYVVRVTDPGDTGGPLEVTNPTSSGPAPASIDTLDPEIMVLLDWSDVAGSFPFLTGVRSTIDVAAAVAEVFATPNFLTDLTTPLAELPLHLIGHSRGGSLVGELAQELGERGIWVDHVTTLDPHPVDGVRDPFGTDFGDAPISPAESVVFWDNYWRTDGDTSLDFTGEPVAGSHDVQLDESILNNFGGYFNEHSDAHLWYHGTVDTSGPIDDGTESVSADAGWYGGDMGPRDAIGYYFSRIVGGPRPAQGIAVSHGGSGARNPIVDHTLDQWPSITQLTVTTPTEFEIGQPIGAQYFWHDQDSDATLSIYLDVDHNPFNGRGQRLGDPMNPGPTVDPSVRSGMQSLPTSSATPGEYYLLAAIEDDEHTRYAYATESLNLIAPPVITLNNTQVQGNVLGVEVGSVTVTDPFSASHLLSVDDDRFEIVADRLRLRQASSLPGDASSSVTVEITATRTEETSQTFSQSFQLDVAANPLPWQNATDRLDVNNDGFVSPIDALAIINELDARTWIDAIGRVPPAFDPLAFFYDTTGDSFVVPLDVLHVINHVNEQIAAQPESVLQFPECGLVSAPLVASQASPQPSRMLHGHQPQTTPTAAKELHVAAIDRKPFAVTKDIDEIFLHLEDLFAPAEHQEG
jgi:hypothetical protein